MKTEVRSLVESARDLGEKDASRGIKTRNAENLMKGLGFTEWTREEATLAGKTYRHAYQSTQIKKARA